MIVGNDNARKKNKQLKVVATSGTFTVIRLDTPRQSRLSKICNHVNSNSREGINIKARYTPTTILFVSIYKPFYEPLISGISNLGRHQHTEVVEVELALAEWRVAHPSLVFSLDGAFLLNDTTPVRQHRGTGLASPGGRPFRA